MAEGVGTQLDFPPLWGSMGLIPCELMSILKKTKKGKTKKDTKAMCESIAMEVQRVLIEASSSIWTIRNRLLFGIASNSQVT